MKRVLLFSTALLLVGCGGAEKSQANDVHANMRMGARPPSTVAASAVVPGEPATVSGDDAVRIMHQRHKGMESIGDASKAIQTEMRKSSPSMEVIRSNGSQIAELAERASRWFPRGSGPEAGKTGAKPAIWQTPQDFAAKLGAFQSAARGFEAATTTNNLNTVKARLGPLTAACKACHDKYRTDMHHHDD